MKTVGSLSTVVIVLSFVLPAAASAGEPPAEQIMREAFWALKLDGSEAIATLIIQDGKGHSRIRKTATVSKLYDGGKTEKRLIKFVSPPDVKGTALLTYDYEDRADDMWLYLPALRKTRRIVAAEKSKSFMGSEFSYADITPPAVGDFHHKLLRSEKVAGIDCWVVESIPKNDDVAEENGFSKKISYIGKEDKVVRKAIQYDLDGELQKELVVREVKLLDPKKKRYRPTHMEMLNKRNGRRSVLKMEKIRLRTDIPDDYFTVRYLERG